MGPRGPREEIADLVRSCGCEVRHDPARGGFVAVDCPDYRSRAELVDALAWSDAHYDGDVRMLALSIVAGLPSLDPESIARAIHAAVASRVRYVGEAGDYIQDPIVTWTYALGDCDCQTRLVAALCRSLAIPCRVVAWLARDGEGEWVRHVVACYDGGRRGLVYMETTLGPGCMFGEDPERAALRLGAARADLAWSTGA